MKKKVKSIAYITHALGEFRLYCFGTTAVKFSQDTFIVKIVLNRTFTITTLSILPHRLTVVLSSIWDHIINASVWNVRVKITSPIDSKMLAEELVHITRRRYEIYMLQLYVLHGEVLPVINIISKAQRGDSWSFNEPHFVGRDFQVGGVFSDHPNRHIHVCLGHAHWPNAIGIWNTNAGRYPQLVQIACALLELLPVHAWKIMFPPAPFHNWHIL